MQAEQSITATQNRRRYEAMTPSRDQAPCNSSPRFEQGTAKENDDNVCWNTKASLKVLTKPSETRPRYGRS